MSHTWPVKTRGCPATRDILSGDGEPATPVRQNTGWMLTLSDVVARRAHDHLGETGHDARRTHDRANGVWARRAVERDVRAADVRRRDEPRRDGEDHAWPTLHRRTLVIQRPRARPRALVAVAIPMAIRSCTGNGHAPGAGESNRRVIASYEGAMK